MNPPAHPKLATATRYFPRFEASGYVRHRACLTFVEIYPVGISPSRRKSSWSSFSEPGRSHCITLDATVLRGHPSTPSIGGSSRLAIAEHTEARIRSVPSSPQKARCDDRWRMEFTKLGIFPALFLATILWIVNLQCNQLP